MTAIRRAVLAAAVLLVLCLIPGCVELCGQRMCVFYDRDKDEIRILLFYDGIHDSQSNTNGVGADQIPQFVADGDILFLDWPFHVQRKELAGFAADSKPDFTAQAAFLQALTTQVKTSAVGRYRDGHGRLGAAQLIVISKGRDFIAKANAAISELITQNASGLVGPDMPQTQKKLIAAAKDNYPWIGLEGQSLRLSWPIHEAEWAALKARGSTDFVKGINDKAVTEREKAGAKGLAPDMLAWLQALSAVPVAYSDLDGRVTVRIGNTSVPSTYRVRLPSHAYEPSLEPVVQKSIAQDLDAGIGRRLILQPDGPLPAGVDDVIAWGPPELKALGLMAVASNSLNDAKAIQAALARLEELAKWWNQNHAPPAAPEPQEDKAAYLAQWRDWCKLMDHYPLPEGLEPLNAPETQPETQPDTQPASVDELLRDALGPATRPTTQPAAP